MSKIYYHFTSNRLRDGRPIPPIGEWLEHPGDVIICESGLHASETPYDALQYAPGQMLHQVELALVTDAGIALPVMYTLGFKNNNCIGCVKATSPKYWDLVRKHFPATFWKRVKQSRELGVRLVRYHGVRMFLDELPDPITDKTPEEDIECGPICLIERIQPADGAIL